MPVYIDNARIPFTPKPGLREMLMCHMVATSLEELHAMADHIKMKREWFQDRNTAGAPSVPHYDVCATRRAWAVKAGAIEVSRSEMADLVRQWRIAKDTGSDCIRGVGQLGLGL